MQNLLALLLFVPSLCLAQLPDYLPTDGLIAYYPLDTAALDESGHEHHIVVDGPTWGAGTGGAGDQALLFDGQDDVAFIPNHPDFNTPELSLSFWTMIHTDQLSDSPGLADFMGMVNKTDAQANVLNRRQFDIQLYADSAGTSPFNLGWLASTGQSVSGLNVELVTAPASLHSFEWNHIVVTASDSTLSIHINGDHIATNELLHPRALNTADIRIGRDWAGYAERHFNGRMDDIAFYNRVLTDEEVQSLFMATAPEHGCTDPEACNFQLDATVDDGSCISCEILASACGEGTVWDSSLQQCVSIAPPCAPSCGEGTIWDPINEECIIAIPADLNYDGCVSVNDLLVLLAVHGTCPPYPEWPDEPTDNTWTCGDPLTYWDYEYATVLIGEQCWFAENLRSTQYQNGDNITLWDYPGEVNTYGIGHYTFKDLNPANADTFGLLYTWHAATHELHLCPTGWRTPSEQDYQTLMDATDLLTGNSSLTHRVNALQSPSIWTLGSGTNATGFAALPGSQRTPWGDLGCGSQCEEAFWWTTNEDNGNVTNLSMVEPLIGDDKFIGFGTCDNPNDGMSVRCLKD